MNFTNLFAAISFISVFIYLHIGFYTLKQNKKSILNKVFFLLCFSYAIWSFAYSFAYISDDKFVFSFWNKFSSFGWCTYSALTLYLVLLLTENRLARNKLLIILIFLPSIVFLYMTLFLFGPGMDTSEAISDFFGIGDFLYDFSYNLCCLVLLVRWCFKAQTLRAKKQANLLFLAGVVPFILTISVQHLLPLAGFGKFPPMGQIFSVILIYGAYTVITKYKMMLIPVNVIVNEVEKKIIELVILLNEKGDFIQISDQALKLLDFEDNDLLGKNITYLFGDEDKEKFSVPMLKQEIEFSDIQILKKNKDTLPVEIMCVPIIDQILDEFLGVLLVIRDISKEYELRAINAELHERTIRDSLTNLYNHQHSLEILEEEINSHWTNPESQELTVMMLDIDFFKKVNDTFGHIYGDFVIKAIADILKSNVANCGYVGRFGGEEFIVILPKTGIEEACRIGEKIRSDVYHYKDQEPLHVTISIGIVQLEEESPMQLLKKADDLLYLAKQNGRNRVEFNLPISSSL